MAFSGTFIKKSYLGTNYDPGVQLVPSASADTKLVLSILKLLGILNFFKYAQNDFGILKSETLVQKLVNWSTPNILSILKKIVYLKVR